MLRLVFVESTGAADVLLCTSHKKLSLNSAETWYRTANPGVAGWPAHTVAGGNDATYLGSPQ